MYRYHTRTALACAALVVVLSACADDSDPVGPPDGLRPQAAAGDVYTVTNTNDAGVGSLRWAVSYVTGGEIIRFDPALAGGTIVLDSSITFTRDFTLEGPAGKGITISGGGAVRHFLLHHTGTVTLRNLTLTGGQSGPGASGGVTNGLGNLVLENVAVYGNRGSGTSAILAGALTLVNTTVSGNVSESSPSGPSGPVKYPPVLAHGPLILINSTIAYNTDGGFGAGNVTMRNSIVSNNGVGRNCSYSQLMLEGVNIADDDSCGGPAGAVIGNPLLAPLADNGGPSLTHALQVGSPAINAGTLCSVAVDQRYVTRDAACDLGAFEFIDFTDVTLAIDANAILKRADGWIVVTGTMRCTRAETFDIAVSLSQTTKKGRTSEVVQANAATPVVCDTVARPWSVALVPVAGVFDVGSAAVTAATANAAAWVTPGAASRTVRVLP